MCFALEDVILLLLLHFYSVSFINPPLSLPIDISHLCNVKAMYQLSFAFLIGFKMSLTRCYLFISCPLLFGSAFLSIVCLEYSAAVFT